MGRLIEGLIPARLGSGFRWLLASSWATNLGDGIVVAAGPLLVASLTRDPLLISLAALLTWAPPLLFALYAGVLSDRLDRRRIVMAADGLRVVVTARAGRHDAHRTRHGRGGLVALGCCHAEVFADTTVSTLTPMLVTRRPGGTPTTRIMAGFLTVNRSPGRRSEPPVAAGRAWPSMDEGVLVAAGVLLVSRVTLTAHGRDAAGAGGRAGATLWGFRWTLHHAAVRTVA